MVPDHAVEGESGKAPTAETDGQSPAVNLAGRKFSCRQELVDHIKGIQKRVAEAQTDGLLEAEDRFLLFHMALRHPRTALKLREPVRAIRYGVHQSFPQNKCFIFVFSNDLEEPVSWTKCVKELFPAPGGAAENSAGAGTGSGPPVKVPRTDEAGRAPQGELSRQEQALKLLSEEAASQKQHSDR